MLNLLCTFIEIYDFIFGVFLLEKII